MNRYRVGNICFDNLPYEKESCNYQLIWLSERQKHLGCTSRNVIYKSCKVIVPLGSAHQTSFEVLYPVVGPYFKNYSDDQTYRTYQHEQQPGELDPWAIHQSDLKVVNHLHRKAH